MSWHGEAIEYDFGSPDKVKKHFQTLVSTSASCLERVERTRGPFHPLQTTYIWENALGAKITEIFSFVNKKKLPWKINSKNLQIEFVSSRTWPPNILMWASRKYLTFFSHHKSHFMNGYMFFSKENLFFNNRGDNLESKEKLVSCGLRRNETSQKQQICCLDSSFFFLNLNHFTLCCHITLIWALSARFHLRLRWKSWSTSKF